MLKLFGTDGIRGIPGEEPLTSENIKKVSAGFATLIRKMANGKKNPPLSSEKTPGHHAP